MSEPVYFVVERVNGRLCPALIYTRMPGKFSGKHAAENGLFYSKRVDDQPHLAGRSLVNLFEIWKANSGKLPDAPRAINPVWPW